MAKLVKRSLRFIVAFMMVTALSTGLLEAQSSLPFYPSLTDMKTYFQSLESSQPLIFKYQEIGRAI